IGEEYVNFAVHPSHLCGDERGSLHLNRGAEAERMDDAGVEFMPQRLETLPCRIAASGSLVELRAQSPPVRLAWAFRKVGVLHAASAHRFLRRVANAKELMQRI